MCLRYSIYKHICYSIYNWYTVGIRHTSQRPPQGCLRTFSQPVLTTVQRKCKGLVKKVTGATGTQSGNSVCNDKITSKQLFSIMVAVGRHYTH